MRLRHQQLTEKTLSGIVRLHEDVFSCIRSFMINFSRLELAIRPISHSVHRLTETGNLCSNFLLQFTCLLRWFRTFANRRNHFFDTAVLDVDIKAFKVDCCLLN